MKAAGLQGCHPLILQLVKSVHSGRAMHWVYRDLTLELVFLGNARGETKKRLIAPVHAPSLGESEQWLPVSAGGIRYTLPMRLRSRPDSEPS